MANPKTIRTARDQCAGSDPPQSSPRGTCALLRRVKLAANEQLFSPTTNDLIVIPTAPTRIPACRTALKQIERFAFSRPPDRAKQFHIACIVKHTSHFALIDQQCDWRSYLPALGILQTPTYRSSIFGQACLVRVWRTFDDRDIRSSGSRR